MYVNRTLNNKDLILFKSILFVVLEILLSFNSFAINKIESDLQEQTISLQAKINKNRYILDDVIKQHNALIDEIKNVRVDDLGLICSNIKQSRLLKEQDRLIALQMNMKHIDSNSHEIVSTIVMPNLGCSKPLINPKIDMLNQIKLKVIETSKIVANLNEELQIKKTVNASNEVFYYLDKKFLKEFFKDFLPTIVIITLATHLLSKRLVNISLKRLRLKEAMDDVVFPRERILDCLIKPNTKMNYTKYSFNIFSSTFWSVKNLSFNNQTNYLKNKRIIKLNRINDVDLISILHANTEEIANLSRILNEREVARLIYLNLIDSEVLDENDILFSLNTKFFDEFFSYSSRL